MGQGWQAFFDKETGLLVEAYTGLGSQIDSYYGTVDDVIWDEVKLNIDKHLPRAVGFDDIDFYLKECFDEGSKVNTEVYNQPLIPSADFVFFMI